MSIFIVYNFIALLISFIGYLLINKFNNCYANIGYIMFVVPFIIAITNIIMYLDVKNKIALNLGIIIIIIEFIIIITDYIRVQIKDKKDRKIHK